MPLEREGLESVTDGLVGRPPVETGGNELDFLVGHRDVAGGDRLGATAGRSRGRRSGQPPGRGRRATL